MGSYPKTIAIDFDGVIHKYSKGWKDGSIYDEPIKGSIDAINHLFESGYNVFIFSTRKSNTIAKWLRQHSNQLLWMSQSDFMDYYYPFQDKDIKLVSEQYHNKSNLQVRVKVIPFWVKFWNKKNVLGITNRKLPAHCYIDDRSIVFNGNWIDTVEQINSFKTYQQ